MVTVRPSNPDLVPRDVVGVAFDFPAGARVPAHRHHKAQLLFAESGVMTVRARGGRWVVPPQRAVWVPAETDHAIEGHGEVAMRTIYVDAQVASAFPAHCSVVSVSPLLRELIVRAVEGPLLYSADGRQARLAAVLLDEIEAAEVAPLHLPDGIEARVKKVTAGLRAAPDDPAGLTVWAKRAHCSPRTLARAFKRETGLSFGQWRRQLRLLIALERLAQGEDVTSVAFGLGYESVSAFIAMFRSTLGETPGRYFARLP
jgi:AraC-like DNA-binding protein